jgi:ATP-dependent DNA helicase RecG
VILTNASTSGDERRAGGSGTGSTAAANPPPGPPAATKPRQDRRLVPAVPAGEQLAAASVSGLPGAGPATTARLVAHGLGTIGDILGFVPRGYDDLRTLTPLGRLAGKPPGAVVLVRGTVTRVTVFPGRFLAVQLQDDGEPGLQAVPATGREQGRKDHREQPPQAGAARLIARWFRVPGGMSRAFEKGQQVVLAGPLRVGPGGQMELLHPTNLTATFAAQRRQNAGGAGLGIRARYEQVPGVGGRIVERLVGAALDRHADQLPDVLPPATRERLGLPSIAEALRLIHRPDPTATAEVLDALVSGRSDAHRRLAVEDLLVIQLGLLRRRAAALGLSGRACGAEPGDVVEQVVAGLPFSLTRAQRTCIAEIQRDMAASRPMQRLLVGDVGSGKTVVAFAAAVQAARSGGGQTLLMAPTEVLAEQHARTLERWAARLGLRVGLLTASTPRPRRESLLALARAGAVAILVGTQALLADQVTLPGLRLAIVDEQHRFGVAQRARLRGRDDADTGTVPHLLVMTATPIPRTLAFTLYGDLDLSVLDELPPGRQPVTTRILQGDQARVCAERAMRDAVRDGRRVFVVCPVREISARENGVTAVDRHRELEATLSPARVGLVHGNMDARAKDAALRDFAAGELDVLVATTVIEVGIDVPEASLMIVEEAERFGLAQLHQLRGRVGRGADAAHCLLVMGEGGGADSSDAARRLSVIAGTNDGFRIAEADLELRGCGDLFGVRQAGMPRLRFADLAGMGRLLELVRAEAGRLQEEDPELERPEHRPLRTAIESRWAAAAIFGEEAG